MTVDSQKAMPQSQPPTRHSVTSSSSVYFIVIIFEIIPIALKMKKMREIRGEDEIVLETGGEEMKMRK